MLDEEHQKQIYLRENILEKGYDGEDFASFLTSKKGEEGVDLKSWSLDELKSIVQEFIVFQTQKLNQVNNVQNNYNIYPNVINNMILNNNINIKFNNEGNDSEILQEQNQSIPLNFPMFNNNNNNSISNSSSNAKNNIYGITDKDIIYCLIPEKTDLAKFNDIKVEITLGEKNPGTFFSKAYQTYIISIPLLNFKVVRRYTDFEWFRQILINLFPGRVIPPIPKKNKLGGDRFKEEFLLKRIRTLEKFFALLLKDQSIKTSQVFYDFISIEEVNAFNDKKKYYNTIKLPQNLKDYKSLDGKLDVKIDEIREETYQNIKSHIDKSQELLSKLNKQIKLLNNELIAVVTRLNDISKCCEELFSNSVDNNARDKIKISYYELADMFKLWSNALKNINTVANVDIREYFKFSRNTLKSIKELINTAEIYKNNYYKSKRNLIAKKEDLYKKGDVPKWDLPPENKNINISDKNAALVNMLYNETNIVNNLKDLYGYYLNSVNCEFSRLESIFSYSHTQNLVENAKKEISTISELFKNISDIAMGGQKYTMKNINKLIEQENNEINKDEK